VTLLELSDALTNPLLWLAGSCCLLAIALTALLVAALPTLLELARVSRSAEKLLDTLNRELPPTLEALRLTGTELSELTDEVSAGVQSASRTVQQVDRSVSTVQKQAQNVGRATRSAFVGFRVAWKTLVQPTLSRETTPAAAPPTPADMSAASIAAVDQQNATDATERGQAIAPAATAANGTHNTTDSDSSTLPLPNFQPLPESSDASFSEQRGTETEA
jgi:uncharacterized protein YoxC